MKAFSIRRLIASAGIAVVITFAGAAVNAPTASATGDCYQGAPVFWNTNYCQVVDPWSGSYGSGALALASTYYVNPSGFWNVMSPNYGPCYVCVSSFPFWP